MTGFPEISTPFLLFAAGGIAAFGFMAYCLGRRSGARQGQRAQEEWRESEEKRRQIFDHATQVFYSHTPDGQLTYVSPRAREFFDCSPADALQPWTEFLTDNPVNAEGIKVTQAAIDTGRAQPSYQLELRSKRSRLLWAEVNESPVVADGKTVAIVGALTDITERKEAEARQRAERERFLRQRDALIALASKHENEEDLRSLVRRLTETDARTLGVARASVWRYNSDRTSLRCLDLYELEADRHSEGMELPATAYPAYFRALAELDVIAAEDACRDPRTCEFAEGYLRPQGITSMLDAPIHLGTAGEGVLCHEHIGPMRPWTADEETFAVAVANRASLILEASERQRAEAAMQDLHEQLMAASRQSGMAEVASNVLHNVGNVLNSVNVSVAVATDRVRDLKVATLDRLATMLNAQPDLASFLTNDPRGVEVPAFLARLAGRLGSDRDALLVELDALRRHIEHINEIVAVQQRHTKACGVTEVLRLADLMEDALRLNADAIERQGLQVVRDYAEMPPAPVDRHKVLQILVNLIRNAKQALADGAPAVRRLTLRLAATADGAVVTVSDNGVGIPEENLTRIFAQGFTTRKEGHGFGLHGSANAAREMGGSLIAQSDGPGCGASFTLELPLQPAIPNP